MRFCEEKGREKEEGMAILLSKIAIPSSFMTTGNCPPERSEGSPSTVTDMLFELAKISY